MEHKIAAIVVTYNRSKLLVECLDCIKNQTKKPQRVYIIDNDSSDDTYDRLKSNNYINEVNQSIEFKYIKMEKNLGGAGGFFEGLKAAFDEGYDLFWVMDDDGKPDNKCLSELIKYSDEYQFISPLVLDIENPDELSFGIGLEKNKANVLSKYKDRAENYANPFNGVVFTRSMVNEIGFPKKDMFIWGDEIEYQHRCMTNGFKIVTILDAIHYHPKDRVKKIYVFFNKVEVCFPDGDLRKYCLFRNYAYVKWKYYSKMHILKWILKYTYVYTIKEHMDIKGLIFFIKSTRDGIKGDFSKHFKYL